MQRSLGRYWDYTGDTHTWDWVQVDTVDTVDIVDIYLGSSSHSGSLKCPRYLSSTPFSRCAT